VRQGAHIINFDNYSNIIAAYTPSLQAGAFHKCLWTGVTLRDLQGFDLTLCKIEQMFV